MRKFEGHCSTAEGFEGIGAVCLGGIEDGDRFGDADYIVGQVVVGDDEIHAEGFGFLSCGEGANAGVYADDQTNSCGGCLAEYSSLHSVAFAEAVRDVIGDEGGGVFGGDSFDGGFEEDGGGGAVDVVVAVDEDGFAGADGTLDADYGDVHAEHEHGVDEVVDCGGEEGLDGRGIRDAAGQKQFGDGLWTLEFAGEA